MQGLEPSTPSEELFARGLDVSPRLVSACATVLEEICLRNDAARASQHTPLLTKFHSVSKPGLPITAYLQRIRKYSFCSNSCFVIALIFLDRAQKIHEVPVISIDSLSVHRLIITAVMLASKVYDDLIQTNKIYATIGGCSTEEINQLEIQLLNALQFQIDVSPVQFSVYHTALVNHLGKSLAKDSTSEQTAARLRQPCGPLVCQCALTTRRVQLHIDPRTDLICSCCGPYPSTGRNSRSDYVFSTEAYRNTSDRTYQTEETGCRCGCQQVDANLKSSPTASDFSVVSRSCSLDSVDSHEASEANLVSASASPVTEFVDVPMFSPQVSDNW